MTREAGGPSEVHIHVTRLVIDGRASHAGVRDLRQGLADRIGRRFAQRPTGAAVEPGDHADVRDAIADAVAATVAPVLRRVETRTSLAGLGDAARWPSTNGMKR